MIAFHGTNKTNASSILQKIDVSLGGGELGRGFYLGEDVSLAVAFSIGRYGKKDRAVVKFEIDDSDYSRLNIRALNSRRYVFKLWNALKNKNLTSLYLFNVDVICAPFAVIDFSYQYKFESNIAQDTLNNKAIKQIL